MVFGRQGREKILITVLQAGLEVCVREEHFLQLVSF